ncbi:PLP-dependent transferase, partial [Acinetobacter baumannii]
MALIYAGYHYAADSWRIGEHSSVTADGPPIYPFKTIIPIAGALVMLDNAWGFGNSAMFEHGVDIVCTALSKYAAGHSDVCLGSITVRSERLFRQIKTFVSGVG